MTAIPQSATCAACTQPIALEQTYTRGAITTSWQSLRTNPATCLAAPSFAHVPRVVSVS